MVTDDVDAPSMSVITKARRVLSALSETSELSVAQIAVALNEPINSIYRIVGHLEGIRWVERAERRGRYRLGVDLIDIAQAVEASLDVRQLALPVLAELNARTAESTYLCVPHDRRAVCIERFDGTAIQASEMPLGGSLPLHRGAGSLAILAFESAITRRAYIAALSGAEANPFTDADVDTLEDTIERVRTDCIAISDGDVTPGVFTVAAPVFDHRGGIVGSIALSGLRARVLSHEADFTKLASDAGRRVSAALGHSSIETD
jgi:DNA-binding IclR family transcriptional regulator